MSESKVAREVAEQEVKNWCEQLECVLDDGIGERLTLAVMAGRLSLDADSEVFTLKLRTPLTLENGEVLSELKIAGPTFRQQQQATKGTEDANVISSRMLSAVAGQPSGILDRLQMKDINTAVTLVGFFG